MGYENARLKKELLVDQIYTVHYFKYQNGLRLEGEKENFWKFQYIDKGEAEFCTDAGSYLLSQGQVVFCMPNEYHSLHAAGNHSLNIISVSFSCSSPHMKFFENRYWKYPRQNGRCWASSSRKPVTASLRRWIIPIPAGWNCAQIFFSVPSSFLFSIWKNCSFILSEGIIRLSPCRPEEAFIPERPLTYAARSSCIWRNTSGNLFRSRTSATIT